MKVYLAMRRGYDGDEILDIFDCPRKAAQHMVQLLAKRGDFRCDEVGENALEWSYEDGNLDDYVVEEWTVRT